MPTATNPRVVDAPPSSWRDVLSIAAVTLITFLLAGYFELNERLFEMTRRFEHLQLDEWPIAVLVLAICLAWLSWWRYRQIQAQLEARQVAERELAAALAENKELAHQHVRILELERKHLARELHDELGQYLNAIKLDAVSMNSGASDQQPAADTAAARIIRSVDHVYGVVRDIIRRLRPVGLDDLGLTAALESCVDQWRGRLPDTHFTLATAGDFEGLGEPLNVTVYRLVQEGLTNSFKHANATHIEIQLRREETSEHSDQLSLLLRDDGRGVDPRQQRPGFGLKGMRERVEMLGGRCSIHSAPGRGFTFEAHMPVESAP